MAQESFYKQYSVALPLMLVVALGPLAALSIGSKVADEETLERARAGLESYQPPNRFADYRPPQASSSSTVMDVTSGSGLFDTFHRSVQSTGLEKTLEGKGPYTVFVPTDRAFDQMPSERRKELMQSKDELSDFIQSHIVAGRLGMTDLMQMDSVRSLSGKRVKLSPGSGPNLEYGDADIVKGNLAAGNGIVHVIDKVTF